MSGYILRRILLMLPVLWAVATITFILMHTIPGGPFDLEGLRQNPDAVAALEARYGLDEPITTQYWNFLSALARGDLGVSFRGGQPVTEVLAEGLPATLQLGLLAFVFAASTGIFLGVTAATHQNGAVDHLSMLFATVAAAIPGFIVAVFLVIVFSLKLGWFAVLGWEFGDPRTMVLPVVALGLFPAAYLARITRAALLDVLGNDYIRTARAKGLRERRVIRGHALRNALVPVLTVSGPILAGLITGSFVIERSFAIPGIGSAFVRAVTTRDYGMIMGTTLLYATVIAFANLFVDIAYSLVDPRIGRPARD